MNSKMIERKDRSFLLWRRLCLLGIAWWCIFGVCSSGRLQFVQAASQGEDEHQQQLEGAAPASCQHAWTGAECSWEPNLRPMTVQNFYGQQETETFYAYVTPDVSSFYNKTDKSLQATKPRFQGLYAKFINMGPEMINIYWRPQSNNKKTDTDPSSWSFIASIEPFGSTGTVSYIGHNIVATLSLALDDTAILTEWIIKADNSLYYHDPFQFDLNKARQQLSTDQSPLYHMQWQNKIFAEQYKIFTNGRDWLSLYKQKTAPRFHTWRADSIGQQHVVTTTEIHYVELPPKSELKRGTSVYGPRPDERGRARRHRHRDATLDLTLTVLSCSPRVFEIENFLSASEIQHLLNLAQTEKEDGDSGQQSLEPSTRHFAYDDDDSSSNNNHIRNAWISRKTDIVTDAIYRRAADVLQMDEALLRWRRATEIPEFKESLISVSEPLQLVYYTQGQEYKPHADFVIPGLVNMQPSRFATMLFYLNTVHDGDGGETIFPRWLHAQEEETSTDGDEALVVKPVAGKAILFYNLLPDGNYDERSIHASLPVAPGREKWMANFWVSACRFSWTRFLVLVDVVVCARFFLLHQEG
jgi:prolyl 4-hydroxylase